MWQAVKDKKRRLAQNYKESRRRSTTGGDTDEDIGIARSIPFDADFVDDRGEFKDYLKTTKDIQKKVILHAQQTITFINGWKNMNETYDEMEGGYETSRGEEWLAEVDKFATLAVAQIENAAGTLLEVLKVRYQAAQETQTGIKRLIDRETDLRSYERRVQEAQNAAKPKPETIQKFTLKLEGAKNDCLQQTVTVKADMEYMKKTKLTAHQPQFNEFMKMCMHVSQKVAELSDPAEAIARLARLQEGSSVMGQGKAKAAAAMASVTGMMGGMMGGGSGGGGGSSDAPKKRPSLQGVHGTQPMMHQPPHRSAPVPTSSSSSNEGPPLPPKNNSHMAAFGAAASSGLMSAKSGMDNAKQQAQQHKEQGKKEQKAAAQGMALGYLKGGKGGALKAAKGSATSAAQSHGSALAQNMPPQKSAPTPGKDTHRRIVAVVEENTVAV